MHRTVTGADGTSVELHVTTATVPMGALGGLGGAFGGFGPPPLFGAAGGGPGQQTLLFSMPLDIAFTGGAE